ncbi:MAG: aldo/keto reductase [Chloroflexota bacterium]
MQYRTFGRLGWEVSEVGYGMWGMGGDWKGSTDAEANTSLHMAVDMDCNFYDTAWAYNSGHSEGLYKKVSWERPDKKMYVATKIPPKNFKWPSKRGYTLDECFPPEHIREYTEKSIANLGVIKLDLQQFHVWEDDWAEDERWMRAVEDLKSEGLIEGIGISVNRWEPWNGIKAIKTGLIDSVQVIYNIFDQAPEDELFPLCEEMNVAVIARVPFDEGTLTGRYTKDTTFEEGDWRNLYFVPENLHESVDRADALKELVPEGMTLPEMALRFILQNDTVSTIIPGMRRPKHVEMNLNVSDGQPLSDELMAELRKHRWDRVPTAWSR